MSSETRTPGPDDILRPIQETSKLYFVLLAGFAALAGVWVLAWAWQLHHGLIVTNLSDWGSGGGSTWGLYIGAFIWWVGIAHGGIILSAAVRLLGMDRYQPVARLAELLTLGALQMAGLYIVVHVGRPDRIVVSVVRAYASSVHSSPLVWDVTVITLYFVLTATYLALTLRYDVSRLRDQLPDMFDPLYSIMLLGYTEKEDKIVERMVWWLALAIIILAPLLLHGGVIPWLFALMPGEPGWFGAIQGPQFLTIALTSAISGVILLGAAYRRAYDWDHIITDDVFRGLTLWLGFFALLFLWLQLQQLITGLYAAPVGQAESVGHRVERVAYWIAMALVAGTLAYIFAQAVRPSVFSIKRSMIGSVAVLIGTLTEKILFVVDGLILPEFDLYAAVPGEYFPSLVELASLMGTISLVSIFFLTITKLFPVVELHAVESHDDHGGEEVET